MLRKSVKQRNKSSLCNVNPLQRSLIFPHTSIQNPMKGLTLQDYQWEKHMSLLNRTVFSSYSIQDYLKELRAFKYKYKVVNY